MATDTETEMFINQIALPVGRLRARGPRTVVAKGASVGSAYSGELMVVGRAVNGWSGVTERTTLADPTNARQFVADALRGTAGVCPMAWVAEQWSTGTKYNTAKSAFWRVIRRVLLDLEIVSADSTDWAAHVVWSNLYKIAPEKKNPLGALQKEQRAGCIALLREELRTYRPKRVLFLTGEWANEFLDDLPWTPSPAVPASQVQQVGRLGDARAVVASHPQCKPESAWVAEVVAAFKAS